MSLILLLAAVINVATFGAVPDDLIDDSVAISAAINAAPDNSTIYFPQGTYLLAGVPINNRHGLTLTGDGSTLTILKRNGNYPRLFESFGSTNMLVTQLGFDANGIFSFGGFAFYDAKRITITKNHFFDSNKKPLNGNDRYSWVFGYGSVPSEDIFISDNLIEDLQLEVDFGLRVRIEGNTVVRPVSTAGIGVFTIDDNSSAQDYTIQNNTVVDLGVTTSGGIVVHLDPPSNNNCTFRKFRILNNRIVQTTGTPSSAIRIGTGNNNQATVGNIFDDIVIQDNTIESSQRFSAPIIYGNSYYISNFKFDNTNVSNNRLVCKIEDCGLFVGVYEQGINYIELGNGLAPSQPSNLILNVR